MTTFPIIDVSDWIALDEETLGTKRKVWLVGPDKTRWLFKYKLKPTTGDDWSEKIAAEIAEVLQIPHADVDLAVLDGEAGVAVRDFTDRAKLGELVLGNALLLEADPHYPPGGRYHVGQHTVDRVLDVLAERRVQAPPTLQADPILSTAGPAFVGYLMLDALISNTDRHHENWGVLVAPDAADAVPPMLAPSFDHASSLGQILTDKERRSRLETRDSGFSVDAFVSKARSALYGSAGDSHALSPLEAMLRAGKRYDQAMSQWLMRLAATEERRLLDVVDAVPDQRMSDDARRFAAAMVQANRTRLLGRRPHDPRA